MDVMGTIFNIQKYSIHDGPGIRTIVFLKGCPLRCRWCSNPESGARGMQVIYNRNLCVNCDGCMKSCMPKAICHDETFGRVIDHLRCDLCRECIHSCPGRALKFIGKTVSTEEVIRQVRKDAIFYRKSGGGVTLSGGEPYVQSQFTAELLRRLKQNRISTAVETTGAVPFESIECSMMDVDLFLYDVKHMDAKVHRRYTGVGNENIQENLRKLNERGKHIWIRVPLIAGVNDTLDNMERVFTLAQELECVQRVELLPYHEYGVNKYAQLGMEYELKGMKPPAEAQIDQILNLASDYHDGLQVIVRRYG